MIQFTFNLEHKISHAAVACLIRRSQRSEKTLALIIVGKKTCHKPFTSVIKLIYKQATVIMAGYLRLFN